MSAKAGLGRGGAALVLALALTLGAAASAAAANIELVNMDDPGEGFNDPTPVAAVQGNPKTTLGEQRLQVFEAVAWRLGTLIASSVTVRIQGGWDSLDCEATRGTLASAGPRFVFRDFDGAPRSQTWYAAALANALAGEDLNDEPVASFTFNVDVGEAGCLTTGFWDYRIGVIGGRGFSVEDTLFHELFHTIGHLSFVDRETGELFRGFDDAYSVHVEDHELGRTWNRLSDAQRLASMTKTGELHWVGGNALARSILLRAGRDPSGHPNLYAPDPIELGSSISHWDTDFDRNVDDYMEPFSSDLAEDLASSRLLQDLGWPVNRSAAAWVEDQNGNGTVELAVLRVSQESGGHEIVVFDSRSRALLQRIPLAADQTAVDLAVVAHHSGPPASEIAVLLWRAAGTAVEVRQFDASTGEEVLRFNFPRGFPLRLLAIPDFLGGSADELVVLGLRPNTGGRAWIKDAGTGTTHTTLRFRKRERPVDLTVLDSFGATPGPEFAALLAVPTRDEALIRVFDGSNRKLLSKFELPAGQAYQFVHSLGDFAGEVGAGELAVSGIGVADGKPTLAVFDAATGEALSAREFDDGFLPASLLAVPSFGGTLADELVLWTRRADDLKPRALIIDGGSMKTLATSSLNGKNVPLAFAPLPDVGRSGALDILVLTASARNQTLQAFLFDGAGGRIRSLEVP